MRVRVNSCSVKKSYAFDQGKHSSSTANTAVEQVASNLSRGTSFFLSEVMNDEAGASRRID